jgi:hypothetical protein
MISSYIYTHGTHTGMHISIQKIKVLEMNIFPKAGDHTHPFNRISPLFNCQTPEQRSKVKREVSTLLSKEAIQESTQTVGKQIFTKLKTDDRQCLLSSLVHRKKGSPVKPTEQVQIGLWFTT